MLCDAIGTWLVLCCCKKHAIAISRHGSYDQSLPGYNVTKLSVAACNSAISIEELAGVRDKNEGTLLRVFPPAQDT